MQRIAQIAAVASVCAACTSAPTTHDAHPLDRVSELQPYNSPDAYGTIPLSVDINSDTTTDSRVFVLVEWEIAARSDQPDQAEQIIHLAPQTSPLLAVVVQRRDDDAPSGWENLCRVYSRYAFVAGESYELTATKRKKKCALDVKPSDKQPPDDT